MNSQTTIDEVAAGPYVEMCSLVVKACPRLNFATELTSRFLQIENPKYLQNIDLNCILMHR